MIQFLQFTEWYQPFIRRGDTVPTQWADRQNSVPVSKIKNIIEDIEVPGCALIWLELDGTIGSTRSYRTRESVQELAARLNAS